MKEHLYSAFEKSDSWSQSQLSSCMDIQTRRVWPFWYACSDRRRQLDSSSGPCSRVSRHRPTSCQFTIAVKNEMRRDGDGGMRGEQTLANCDGREES